MLDREAIRNRLTKISPTPWECDGDGLIESVKGGAVANIQYHGNINTISRTGEYFSSADGQFIANAPDDIAALLAEVDRLRSVLLTISITESVRAIHDLASRALD